LVAELVCERSNIPLFVLGAICDRLAAFADGISRIFVNEATHEGSGDTSLAVSAFGIDSSKESAARETYIVNARALLIKRIKLHFIFIFKYLHICIYILYTFYMCGNLYNVSIFTCEIFFDPLKITLVTKERFLISYRRFSNSIINHLILCIIKWWIHKKNTKIA